MTDSEKLDLLINKIDTMETKIDTMETKIDTMETKMDTMETKIATMETKIATMEQDITGIKIKLENEIEKNIRFIAEGHLDLSRALHEATKPQSVIEMMQVQISILESKVRDLEQKVS